MPTVNTLPRCLNESEIVTSSKERHSTNDVILKKPSDLWQYGKL